MKLVITETRAGQLPGGSEFSVKQGDVIEANTPEAAVLCDNGWAIPQAVHNANQALIKAREAAIDGAIRASKAFKPKQDTAKIKEMAIMLEAGRAGAGVEYIESMPAQPEPDLTTRATSSTDKGTTMTISRGSEGLDDAIQHVFKANEPFGKTEKNGGIMRVAGVGQSASHRIEDAIKCSREKAIAFKKLGDMIKGGADFILGDNLIKAADYADSTAGNPLGVLNTGLTLQWNLGFLANQLVMLNDIVTDVSNTPALFNQVVRTRYIKVPGVQLKTLTNSWSGAQGTDVDVNITMTTFAGVPITINNFNLNSTARQLFNEQKQAQLYGLGEYIIYKGVNVINNGSSRIANDGTTTATKNFAPTGLLGGGTTFNVANATLATFVANLPAAMDLAKLPGGDEEPGDPNLQRFAWVHTSAYAAAAQDTNFLLNQSIWGAVAKQDENLLETGRFSRLGNIKFRKSQLVTDQITTTGSGADGGTNAITVSPGDWTQATKVGLAGTRNCLIFCSRVPLDYTRVLPEIPATAAVELVTEPRTGITFMVLKYLDHAAEAANMRVELMFDWAIGDERQGIPLVQK